MSKPKVYGSTKLDALAVEIRIGGQVWTHGDWANYPCLTLADIASTMAAALANHAEKPQLTIQQLIDGVTYTEEDGFTTTITLGNVG